MTKEIDLLHKYDKNKPIWDCMSGKEVKKLTADIQKEMEKLSREAELWRGKLCGVLRLKDEKRIEFEQRWRNERKVQLQEVFDHIESQVKDWYAA